jgi:hypothetical protein
LKTDIHKSFRMDEEAVVSANILATEASINAKMKQLTNQVRTEVGGVVDKVNAVQDVIIKVTNTVNIKKHIDNSPLKMLALSMIAGLFAGKVLRREKSSAPLVSAPIATGPGLFSLLALGILRPVLTDIVREVAHRTLTQRNIKDRSETLNGVTHDTGGFTH